MSVVGFDIGNHKCVVAVARRRGIDVLQNEVGNRATPTYVAFAGKQRLIGNEAAAQVMSNAANTVHHMKRLLGRRFDDPTLSVDTFNFKLSTCPKQPNNVGVEVSYDDKKEVFAPEQIMGALFGKLKAVAESGLEGLKVTDCVISCPPWWNDAQRRAMLDAANVAGLNVLRLMNETTAVGLNYGILRPLPKDKEQKVLFVDCGHSQTNASLISFTEGKLVVLGTASDSELGGRSFDEILVNHFANYIKTKYNMDVRPDVKAMLKLRKECERVKLNLSANSKVQFNVEYIMNDRDVSGIIDRSELEGLAAASFLPRLQDLLTGLLKKCNVAKEELQSIEIVGGTVRIPIVQKSLSELFGRDMSKTCDGDESVARGCALMCAMISPSFKVKEFEVHDVSPYPIALEWGSVTTGQMKPDDSTPLFSVNNPIPSVKLISFADRLEPFQLVARYRDESGLPTGTNPILGRFVISGMPNKAENGKVPTIKVRVKLNLHGVLQVYSAQLIESIETKAGDAPMEDDKAEEKPVDKMDTTADATAAGTEPTKEAKEAAVKKNVKKTDLKVESFPTGGIDNATLTTYFEREAAMFNQDRVIFETNQSRNDLESYVLEMRNKLSDDLSEYVKESDKDKINELLTATEDWLYGDGYDSQKSEYKKKLTELKALGDPIANRKFEADHRNEAAAALKQSIGHFQRWVSTSDEKYAHIGADDRKTVLDETTKLDEWLSSALSQADRAPKTENPTIKIADFKVKQDALERQCNAIVNKPKPAPPKAASPAPEAKTNGKMEDTPTPDAEAPKMDTTA